MRISELGKFYPEGREAQEQKENPETEKDETLVTPEQAEKKITTAEAIVGVIALGIRVKLFMADKGVEVKRVVQEAKKDVLTEPAEVKPILGKTIADIGSLIVDHITERKERRLEIRQRFANSVGELAGKLNKLEMLRGFEEVQQEEIAKTLSTPLRPVGLSEDDRIKLREKTEIAKGDKVRKEKESFYKFVDGLLNS
ncbi:MAG: hypothetical protein Q8Q95_00355 [bacterium]|nr:hypothetical protein [bacterium]